MSVDELIDGAMKTAGFLRERAEQIAPDNPDEARAYRQVADSLEASANFALAPSDLPEPDGNLRSALAVDRLLAELKHPLMFATRETTTWGLRMTRRAYSILKHVRPDAEIVSAEATLSAIDLWLKDFKDGPSR